MNGEKITIGKGKLTVPDHPVIPFIEGDGTGPDIWNASVRVFDTAVEKDLSRKEKDHMEGSFGWGKGLQTDR